MENQASIKDSVKVVAASWVGSPYYDHAEAYTHMFWDQDVLPFKRMFHRLDLTAVLELACGHGRHAEKIKDKCSRLILMDVLPENIDFCRKRLIGSRISFQVNNGFDFEPVADASVTSIFCYDAMVHFSADIVASYLKDAARILISGGKVLFHHSNYSGPQAEHYGLHPGARNYMPRLQFQKLAIDAGLAILESVTFEWDRVDDLDCLTLMQKA